MQTKPSDTPKIIGLIIAILIVIPIVIWQIISATRSPAAGAATSAAAAPTTNPTATVQKASVVETAQYQPGQVRTLTQLDAEPQPGSPLVPGGSANAFRLMKPTPPSLPHVTPAPAPHPNPTPAPNPFYRPSPSPWGGENGGNTETGPRPQWVTTYVAHPLKVEGVVIGKDGFAMLTEGDQTYFPRVGDSLYGWKVRRLSEYGVVVERGSERAIWPIGKVTELKIARRVLSTEVPTNLPTAPVSQGLPPMGGAVPVTGENGAPAGNALSAPAQRAPNLTTH